jgi:chorismate synthase
LNAIKSVRVGFDLSELGYLGSRCHDELQLSGKNAVEFSSNRAGGITGGMSTGQEILVSAAMKPLATLMKPLSSVNLQEKVPTAAHVERSDVCAVPSAAVIGESLLALVITDFVLEKFGGDSLQEVKKRVDDWNEKTRSS